jgi:TorA maturation chaperone TorD
MLNVYAPDFTSHVLRFFARCLLFPYEEMIYELQHMFRQIEFLAETDDELITGHEILAVLNTIQGEDIEILRADYVFLFSSRDRSAPACPMLAGDFSARFGIPYQPDDFVDLMYDNDFMPGEDESIDSVVNYLEYFAALLETGAYGSGSPAMVQEFFSGHIATWIPAFCDALYKSANASFYRELAAALKRFLLSETTDAFPG